MYVNKYLHNTQIGHELFYKEGYTKSDSFSNTLSVLRLLID